MGGKGDGHRVRVDRDRDERTAISMELEAAAIKWPKLMRALDSLPPTPSEIDKVRVSGYPKGYTEPRKDKGSARWEYRYGDRGNRLRN
jgi:hypothetical protein